MNQEMKDLAWAMFQAGTKFNSDYDRPRTDHQAKSAYAKAVKEWEEEEQAEKELREATAKLAHEQWANWMAYLFVKGTYNADGSWTMPEWAVRRWTRQMNTRYKNLSEVEQQSDRIEADKFIEVWYEMQKEKYHHECGIESIESVRIPNQP